MQIMELLAGLISLASLFFKRDAEGKAVRFALAADRIKQLEKATDDEIAKQKDAHDRARDDPNVGRL